MTSPQPAELLATAIRVGAAGLYSLEAACELLISTGWLHRDDFARFIRTETPCPAGTEVAEIDWQAVIASRDVGQLRRREPDHPPGSQHHPRHPRRPPR
jgi:hypothetical protein